MRSATKVFVNGAWVGCTLEPAKMMNELLTMRRRLMGIAPEVSLFRDIRDMEIQIRTDAGRIMRPLLIVEKQNLLLRQQHVAKIRDEQTVRTAHVLSGLYRQFSLVE